MERDDIGEIEKNLSEQLRSLCDKNGKENDPIKSVSIFLELAKVYESTTESVELSSIRSAALLNAAIVREPNNTQIRRELQRFCSAVLVKAKAKKVDADLVKNSKQVRQKLNTARNELDDYFVEIKIIPDNVKGDELLALEKKRVTDVRNLQNKMAGKYSELMRFVSDSCIEIMGEPPCKYSLAAMGSLARSEVTLYSDFEFIILLENDVAKKEDREIILKYFRWFYTIFHICIINLGETVIPSVAIPSLKWFYDKITPNGVSFDGMVAHASKIPLGRRPTEKKPWKTELIKTVDEMLEHLKPEEILKEGYHLGDMLGKTGYISGDKRTFAEYQQKSNAAVESNDKKGEFSELFKQVDENLRDLYILDQQSMASVSSNSYNIKKVIYRSATIFISAIGRLYSIKESSCFDIIQKLDEDKRCSGIVAHKLRFMVAIACEVRFKVYQSNGTQNDIFMEGSSYKTIISGLVRLIGKRSLTTFMTTTYMVQRMFKKKLTADAPLDLGKLEDAGWRFRAKLSMLYWLRFVKDFRLEIEKLGSTIQPSDVGIRICVGAVRRLYNLGEYQLGLNLCGKILPLCEDVLDIFRAKIYELRCKIRTVHQDKLDVKAQIGELDKLNQSVEDSPPGEERRWAASWDYARCLHILSEFTHAIDVWETCCHRYQQWKQTPQTKYMSKYDEPRMLKLYALSFEEVGNVHKASEVRQKASELLEGTNQSSRVHMDVDNPLDQDEHNLQLDLYFPCDIE